jgi:hypothetical protein
MTELSTGTLIRDPLGTYLFNDFLACVKPTVKVSGKTTNRSSYKNYLSVKPVIEKYSKHTDVNCIKEYIVIYLNAVNDVVNAALPSQRRIGIQDISYI